jgi:hypothetical protein
MHKQLQAIRWRKYNCYRLQTILYYDDRSHTSKEKHPSCIVKYDRNTYFLLFGLWHHSTSQLYHGFLRCMCCTLNWCGIMEVRGIPLYHMYIQGTIPIHLRKLYTTVFVGHRLATKVFIGYLPATRGVQVIIG